MAPVRLPRFQKSPRRNAGAKSATASKDFRPMSTRL